MLNTPKGLRLHIGIYGRRNVGKSSFLNAVTDQDVAIVSPVAGTTTDPVEKAMELLPVGPVQFIDTAGVDDIGTLGAQRIERTRKTIERTDVAVLIAEAQSWGAFEDEFLDAFDAAALPVIVVFNKTDLSTPSTQHIQALEDAGRKTVAMVATQRTGVAAFKQALIEVMPDDFLTPPPIVGDLVNPGAIIVLVVPIDLEAPKGRLILPQVQTIRDALDHDACCVVVKARELRNMLGHLKHPPALVVTDSQAFLKVDSDTPTDVQMTSFSILFARIKGDLATFAAGATALEHLRAGNRILIAEACTHHPIGEDIGRVKLPRWLRQYTGSTLDIDVVSGRDFPDSVADYDLVIHCGSCTFNRRQVLSRILQCRQAGVPITNYGLAIAFLFGILRRTLAPFPDALTALTSYQAR